MRSLSNGVDQRGVLAFTIQQDNHQPSMSFARFSLRSVMVISLVVMSMALVLVAWEVYRDSALETQQQSLRELLKRETGRIMQQLTRNSEALVQAVQADPALSRALAQRDTARLEGQLTRQFRHPLASSDGLDLAQLYIYDPALEILAWSGQGPSARGEHGVICAGLIQQAGGGETRPQTWTELCQWRQRAYYAVLVALGADSLAGYLQVVVDPLQRMARLEAFLQMPLEITLVNGETVYRSPQWRGGRAGEDFVTAAYWLNSPEDGRLARVSVQQDLALFNERLGQSRNLLMALAGAITLVIVLITLWVMHRSMVRPLHQFIDQLHLVRRDRRNLGKVIDLPANAELRELVQVFNEMSRELARAYDEYEELAFTDQLTSLPNRALFLDRLKQLILLSKRKGERFGVMLLDLDGFKEVNETLGHELGDDLLRHIAFRLQSIIRASSTIARVTEEVEPRHEGLARLEAEETTVARLGGDEFAILLPNLGGVEGAVAVARRITAALEEPAELDGSLVMIAATVGIAMFPEHGESAESLLRRADVALSAAKQTQADFSIYDPAHDRHSVKHLALKAELRHAIEGDQLELHYQPRLDLRQGCIAAAEALVRWRHPEQGLIAPRQFVPMSEQRGLIGPLTEWVIRRALQDYRAWQEQGVALRVAVNLSARVLYDLSLPGKIEKLMVNAGLAPAALALEITEEATTIDPDRAMLILQRLDDMGIALSIDDFGTGHSSLSYLKRLPVDEIKIDRSFVSEMDRSEHDAKIVHATIDLAHNLGLGVIAEGVESARSLALLQQLNCDYVQGFHVSEPMPAGQMLAWLAQSGYGACSEHTQTKER